VAYCCIPDVSPAPALAPPEAIKPFTLAYTGMIGPFQDLGVLLDAFKQLAASGENVLLKIAGSGLEYEKLTARVRDEKIPNVVFLNQLPLSKMAAIYQEADALLVHLKPDTLSVVSIPSKTYFYMAAAKPVLMAVNGEASAFVKRYNLGVTAQAGDHQSIADAVIRLLRLSSQERARLGQNGRETFDKLIAGDVQVAMWEKIFERLATNARAGTAEGDAGSGEAEATLRLKI
jgi:colanic acid biosynthesis glycosyl transferase WcaI